MSEDKRATTIRGIGTLALSCLMIGAVLGSGIIILPPLALATAGQWALVAWAGTALFGVGFAYVFAVVGTRFPGEGGAASSVERVLGPGAKRLGAYCLMGAVISGPVAVMMTIVQYLPPELAPTGPGRAWASMGVLLGCALLILSGLKNMSRATTIFSVLATVALCAGAGATLLLGSDVPPRLPPFDPPAMGRTLLLLFWAVVGWEVVGNYGAEVRDPKRTVVRAAILAAVIIGVVDLLVGAGMQWGRLPHGSGLGVDALLHPLFGRASAWVMAALVAGLCATTYLMFVGGVSRLAAHMAETGDLPRFFALRNRFGVPHVAVLCFTGAHALQLWISGQGLIDVASVVAVADGFFLVNALLGTLAAARLFTARLPRYTAWGLSLAILVVLSQAHWQSLVAVALLAAWCLLPRRRKTARS